MGIGQWCLRERSRYSARFISIDITSSSINRLDLYADLGVPEVWRYDGRRLTIYRLEAKRYHWKTTRETTLSRLFRDWVKSQLRQGE